MKSQKGISLISLTIYLIAMSIVIAIIAVISTYFYKNTNSLLDNINPLAEYTKFNTFFSDEVNHNNIKILECKTNYKNGDDSQGIENSYVAFDNGVQYMYIKENKGIYRNQVKICENVENCTFERKIKNGKDVIAVSIKIEEASVKNTEYTLNN